mmetsp:Transcript_13717/g.41445  ORF Transcript_13717/g.41445 Transcript_13717/m.41445 type:complete len:210 (+) Transcript_13717:1518-2147(+)
MGWRCISWAQFTSSATIWTRQPNPSGRASNFQGGRARCCVLRGWLASENSRGTTPRRGAHSAQRRLPGRHRPASCVNGHCSRNVVMNSSMQQSCSPGRHMRIPGTGARGWGPLCLRAAASSMMRRKSYSSEQATPYLVTTRTIHGARCAKAGRTWMAPVRSSAVDSSCFRTLGRCYWNRRCWRPSVGMWMRHAVSSSGEPTCVSHMSPC